MFRSKSPKSKRKPLSLPKQATSAEIIKPSYHITSNKTTALSKNPTSALGFGARIKELFTRKQEKTVGTSNTHSLKPTVNKHLNTAVVKAYNPQSNPNMTGSTYVSPKTTTATKPERTYCY